MPFLVPFLLLASGFGFGAFTGAQVDDKLEPATPQNPVMASPLNIAFYAFIGMGLIYVARKAKII